MKMNIYKIYINERYMGELIGSDYIKEYCDDNSKYERLIKILTENNDTIAILEGNEIFTSVVESNKEKDIYNIEIYR